MRVAIDHVIDDSIHLQIHMVDFSSDEAEKLEAVLIERFGTESLPSATWLGDSSLARPEYLVEIQGIAVLPASLLVSLAFTTNVFG